MTAMEASGKVIALARELEENGQVALATVLAAAAAAAVIDEKAGNGNEVLGEFWEVAMDLYECMSKVLSIEEKPNGIQEN